MLRAVDGMDTPNDVSVSRSILKSLVLAPVTGHEMGMPFLSVVRLLFVPILALSVGFLPIFFPTQWSFGHRAVSCAETPVDSLQFIVGAEQSFPYLLENSALLPFLKSFVRSRRRTDARFVERIPLSSCLQDEEYAVHDISVGNTGPVTPQRMVVSWLWNERLNRSPQTVGNNVVLANRWFPLLFHSYSIAPIRIGS